MSYVVTTHTQAQKQGPARCSGLQCKIIHMQHYTKNKNPMKMAGSEISPKDSEAFKTKKANAKHKLTIVRKAIIEILTESPSGLSFAQLPLRLKHKLPFPLDLNELGFVKLKELIGSMPDQVELDLREHNHPFARLIVKKNSEPSRAIHKDTKEYEKKPVTDFSKAPLVDLNYYLTTICNSLYQILHEFPYQIDSTKLLSTIYTHSGICLDLAMFNCSSLLEFMQKYISSYLKIELIQMNPYDFEHFIIRSKDIYAAYSNIPQYPIPQYLPGYYSIPYEFDSNSGYMNSYTSAIERDSV